MAVRYRKLCGCFRFKCRLSKKLDHPSWGSGKNEKSDYPTILHKTLYDRSILNVLDLMQTRSDSTRDHILATGRGLVAQRGFAGMGLNELLKSASVPKGSFYHYFSSKEDFGCKLLEQYMAQYMARLDEILTTEGPDARARLMQYWSLWTSSQTSGDACVQCLIVKIGAEISDVSEEMRGILEAGTRQIAARLSQAIAEGQTDQSISLAVRPDQLGTALYEMWLGASLMAKLSRTRDPFLNAMATTELMLPQPPQHTKEIM
jgi:TetR/AcrR family transcriptional repressor of nem operon